jgi:hypothetical protein
MDATAVRQSAPKHCEEDGGVREKALKRRVYNNLGHGREKLGAPSHHVPYVNCVIYYWSARASPSQHASDTPRKDEPRKSCWLSRQ